MAEETMNNTAESTASEAILREFGPTPRGDSSRGRATRTIIREDAGNRREGAASGLKVLVVEDSVTDLNTCVGMLQRIGVQQLDACSNVPAGLLRLEEMLEGRLPNPDLIIVDLAFPIESGFEILRFWKSHPELKNIPVIVWTVMGDTEQQLCQAFGVNRVVPKWAGGAALEAAVIEAAKLNSGKTE
jgi:CheY-like chemotaxis protein